MKEQIRKIVAIGGGELTDYQHLKIHKEIVKLSNKNHPKVLFIPTASYDTQDYNPIIEKVYGEKLGCKVDYLYLLSEKLSKKQIENKILTTDIIYVPGGNTLKMMKLWHKLGVDKLLKTAWKKGIVLSGISAGSICWFDSGHSDSMSYYNPKKWKYVNVKGMGLIKGVHCPHYDSETLGVKRKDNFRKMMEKTGVMGIAIDNDCALEFINDKFRVISAKKNANTHKVYKKNKKVISEIIPIKKELTPIATLYET